ncbi:T9SS type A sorting domain-containing protein [Prevotella sp. HUN102]|uniref:T9SS type A sorting domain-containing protein n=1 Tax=Prevotella sp. HUN102 TaxID=1392486 RepID=UPI00049082A4|nr:T9SS type A sorting domain-containing protein [Prevotella sp. HUN102]
MAKKIFTFLIALMTLSFALPTNVEANTAIVVTEQEFQNITISVYGSVLRVEGANDEMMHIYNVTGVRVMSVRVDGQDKRYNLNLPKGCYIVKVGKVVRKISIR